MSRLKNVGFLFLGAMVATLVIGAVAIGTVSAKSTANLGNNQPAPMENFAFVGDDPIRIEALAQALGISTGELEAAMQKAKEAGLKQAVEQGLITQAQADELLSTDRAHPFMGRWVNWLSRKGIDFEALLADALGISPDELQAARLKAQEIALDQAVQDGKISEEQANLMKARRALFADSAFRSAMKSAFEEAVKSAVERGVITQEQADLILAKLSAVGEDFQGMPLPGFGGFPGRGGRHGGPGLFGGGLGVPPATPTSTP